MIGCRRPYTTMAPLTKPASAPDSRTTATPAARVAWWIRAPSSIGGAMTTAEPTQFDMMKIMPTERSRPRVSTGRVCAMATSASSTPVLAALRITASGSSVPKLEK